VTTPHSQRRSRTPITLPRRRRWAFRIAAVLLGLSVIGIAEATFRITGWGRPTEYPDPYVGFSEVHPLFVRDETAGVYRIPDSRRGFFAAESFPAKKGSDTYRIFCLGGSTVQGRPYSKPTAFTTWLELSLNAGDDRREWEVVNCGGISYASYRLTPILKECLQYQPDLFIICTGHNEFLEDRTYEHIKHAPQLVSVPARHLSRLHTVTLLRSAVSRITGSGGNVSKDRPVLKGEVDALLDYRDGLRAYKRDETWRAGVVEHFGFNLRRMIALADAADVPVVLVLPPSNLRDTPPFKSQHKDDLTNTELKRWKELTDRARTLYRKDLPQAMTLLERAVEIDELHAATVYELGRCYDALWRKTRNPDDHAKAKAAYLKARELDICPLRMIQLLEEMMRKVAQETETPLIDAHKRLQDDVPDGILGNQLLVDHIHPSPILGHRRIAHALAKLLEKQGVFRPSERWPEKREQAFGRHLKQLDDLYFPHGQRTLRALRAWAKGRADGPPIETRVPSLPKSQRNGD